MKIKKNIYMLLLVWAAAAICITAITASCSGRVKVIPEISQALYDDVLGAPLKDANIAGTIIVRKNNANPSVVFFTLEGKIYRFNLKEKLLDFLVDLTIPIEPEIIQQEDIVVLKEKNSANFIFFDLQKMAVIQMPREINADKIISIDAEREIIGYLTGRRLIFSNYTRGKILAELTIETSAITNDNDTGGSEDSHENNANHQNNEDQEDHEGIVFFRSSDIVSDDIPRTLVLTPGNLYIFNKKRHTITSIKLESKASSGFLYDGGAIYYGSENRELVKLSLANGKAQWRFKLAEQLTEAPRKAGPYIVITPEDHNIYFFNKRGTLYWWEKLDSTRLLPPVVMNENVAVFLWNKTIKFFNYRNKSTYTYPLHKPVFSEAVHVDGYLYAIAAVDVEKQGQQYKAVTKIGNNFGVVIKTDPPSVIPMGKSIKFNLEKFNLVKPELKVNILDNKNESVFTKTISDKDDPAFVWIPNRAMVYKLVVEINAENKKGLIIEHPFEVINIEKLLSQYYYQLQKNNNEDLVIHHSSYGQDGLYPPETAGIEKNEKTRTVPARKKN